MADKKIILCSGCRTRLEVINSKNEEVKHFRCPVCSKKLMLKFDVQPSAPIDDNRCDSQLVEEQGITSLPKADAPSGYQTCCLECGGKRYPLAVGRNSVGRRSTSSLADVQIITTDQFMSRAHTIINVNRKANGNLLIDLSNDQNKNATLVNQVKLCPGDTVVLHNGDSIVMGRTKMTVRIVDR